MKNLLSIASSLLLIFSFCACNDGEKNDPDILAGENDGDQILYLNYGNEEVEVDHQYADDSWFTLDLSGNGSVYLQVWQVTSRFGMGTVIITNTSFVKSTQQIEVAVNDTATDYVAIYKEGDKIDGQLNWSSTENLNLSGLEITEENGNIISEVPSGFLFNNKFIAFRWLDGDKTRYGWLKLTQEDFRSTIHAYAVQK